METQDQWHQDSVIDPIVIDNFMNMFGDVTSKEVIIAVLESCDGDLNLAVEGIMNLTSDSSPHNEDTNIVSPVAESEIVCNKDVIPNAEEQIQPTSFNMIPAPIVTPLPNQSYAAASQSTGAIPKEPTTPRPVPDTRNNIWTDQLQQIIKNHNQGSRILIILRGASGSGKSYLAKKIVEMTVGSTFKHYKSHIFSTDDFFNIRGTYVFNKYQLTQAHKWNHDRVQDATRQGWSPIIVDNTNINIWEMEPYVRFGVQNGYFIEVMEPTTPWAKKAFQLARRNVHGVPISSIKRMLDNLIEGVTGETLMRQYSLSYSTSMVPPIIRNMPAFGSNDLLSTAESAQPVQVNEFKVAATKKLHEDDSSKSAVIEQSAAIICHQEEVSAINENVKAISIEDNNEPGENKNEVIQENLSETGKKDQAEGQQDQQDISEEINQDKVNNFFFKSEVMFGEVHKIEDVGNREDKWVETNNPGQPEEQRLQITDPKSQRSKLAADLPKENEASISGPASVGVLMDSVTNCEDWRQISMFMPPWHDASSSNSIKSPDIPIVTISSSTCMEIGDTDDTGCKYKVISAIPRDINEFYVPHEKEKIPEKRMLDKSSMTNDTEITEPVRCKNEEKHFIAFRKLFRNIPQTSLRDIFDQCCGDVNWAVEIFLDGMTYKEFTEVNSVELSDQEEEVSEQCGCISNYHVIPDVKKDNVEITNNEHIATETNETASASQPRRKAKKDIPLSETSMQLKRQIENNVAISESHYSEHCLKIRKMRRSEYSRESEDNGQSSSSGTAVVGVDEAASCMNQECEDSDDDNSVLSSEELEKIVSVNLGADFVAQLDQMFGRNNMQYPDSIVHNVSMPMSLLNEINALWMESIMNQFDVHSNKSALMMKQDEEFARALERKELELSEQGLEPVVPDFKEIMDLDYALTMYNKDVAAWRDKEPNDLAAKLSREKLYNLFPEVSPDVLSELLMAHNNNFKSTVEVLLASTGRADILKQKHGINRFIVASEIDRKNKDLVEQKRLCKAEWPPLAKGEDIEMTTVIQYREEADMHLARRNHYYQKAQGYVRDGATMVANFYFEVASFHKQKYEQANSLAASSLIQFHAEKNGNRTIDLHYLRVSEAKESLDLFLDTHIQKLKETQHRGGPRFITLFFITGRGLHSPGLPRVKPAIRKRLIQRRLLPCERNPGLLLARVCADDLLSYEVP